MEIKTKYSIGDTVYFLSGMKIYKATIDTIEISVNKPFGKLNNNIKYYITAHTNTYVNFIPKESPIEESLLFNSETELINNIEIIK